MERSAFRLGIDVGGTFTDVLVQDDATGQVRLLKTPSTPWDQSEGVIRGVSLICDDTGIAPSELSAILHGTTAATNAVLEQRGARVGVLVTEGFRQMFHLAEAWTPGPLFGFMVYDKPEPLVDVDLVAEVPGRIDARGRVVRELDEGAVEVAVNELVAAGAETLTVCLMNAYADDRHERRVAEIARRVAPDLGVSLSSEVMAEFREYERAVTTTMNAYVTPELDRYLSGLRRGMASIDAGADLQVVRSDGGLMSLDAARATPVHTMLSGPAGGVNGAAHIASRAGYQQIITLDMGGTSTDVALCLDGEPTITHETHVGPFPMRVPSIEIETIGAGGGSIAWVADVTGALRVGPRSAGSSPGPACYGAGATEPTVTDANVALGHLPPRLLGGAMELDRDAAHEAVGRVAAELGLGVPETAQAIVDLVNENMLGALRVVTVQRGLSPDRFALVPFGGAGGLHGNALARMLGCFPVVVPPEPGVLSALGFVVSDVRSEHSQTFIRLTGDVSTEHLRGTLGELGARGRRFLEREGVPGSRQEIQYSIDMRYQRQGYELPVPVGSLDNLTLDGLVAGFTATHERLYGFSREAGAELVTLRALAIGRVARVEVEPEPLGPADASTARSGTQSVWREGAYHDVPTYQRATLHPGMVVRGHAIVEQYDSTTVVLPGHLAEVDAYHNLVIRPEERA
jgi:N-methylhydantoinase A